MSTETLAPVPAPQPDGKAPILEVRDLAVEFFVDGEWYPAAIDVSYDVRPGEVLAIVGESGSGKTQSSMSLIGLLPPNGRASGSAKLAGRELLGLTHKQLSSVRGKEVAVIFQEPMTALNPVYTVGFQIIETLRVHFDMGPKAARVRAVELLKLVDIPDPERAVDKYPHQLSGGQRQRAMIAQALACDPKLLIADEPTTALDVTVQAEILKLMRDLRSRIDSGIVLITHDMGVVADLSDRVLVMKNGRIVEQGTSDAIFNRPTHPYTIQLLESVPHLGSETFQAPGAEHDVTSATTATPVTAPAAAPTEFALEARDLVIEYPSRGRIPAFRAINSVDLTIGRGEVLGLVGESGSGKTTVGRAAVGLLPVAGGSMKVNGVELAGIKPKALRGVRQDVSIVFQDPGSSLNPRLPIGESIGEPLKLHGIAKGAELSKRVEDLLDRVHLQRSMRNRYPHELSGGQRQRVGIARALALSPKLLIADEPTSALDVSVQARVLELFQELQREYGFACLFISHDLAVVEILSSRIAVLNKGQLVEVGPRDEILRRPQQDYTRRLLAAVPVPNPAEQKLRREERDRLIEEAEAALRQADTEAGRRAAGDERKRLLAELDDREQKAKSDVDSRSARDGGTGV
ncbi:ABC transporter ATP-binding protein [Cellulomonas fimi]|uniref:ABC transporter related protein n=1 Tax=Cellulomonas fimi (strain ATCC 484 / DSM 20113 / JCM 1341 / CCUG 24087 / LMG 16345 / NBRC 15513 / NCIMB 8980 / NCTC 7547 / NRS-133) TaxID=590998 RepID=F4H8L6_CELFA|nr:ABC transporter ATP-binding protein [Cellulomonas fimi]AEE47024.1 ABC transporter related protein [Cellulomonas fimi ATCC 484]NNH07767.1 ABC transporter ATP-binding protein [Cellulomonas fimi]VEH34885.1 Glutathione import ATP-binding protein GsiA [Cellulomonas fimi]